MRSGHGYAGADTAEVRSFRDATPLFRSYLLHQSLCSNAKRGRDFQNFSRLLNSLVGDTVECRAEISQGNARGVVRC